MFFQLIRSRSKFVLNHSHLLGPFKKVFNSNREITSTALKRNMDKIIAIGQMCATNDKVANRKQVEEIIKSAVKQDACVRVLFFSTLSLKFE